MGGENIMREFRFIFKIPDESRRGFFTREFWARNLEDAKSYYKSTYEVKRMPNGWKYSYDNGGF